MTLALGRLVIPALRWRADSGFMHERDTIDEALALGAGGFIIFGGTRDGVRLLTDHLVQRAGRPLLIAADLERGPGQQFEGLTELPPPRALASLGDLEAVRWAGAVTAAEARSVGVNWVFAPVADLDIVADNPIVQTRAFGGDPAPVAACVRAWIEGCQDAGALACAKHYPGHGRTTADSHIALPVVQTDATVLDREDGAPFDAAIAAGVASIMTAHVAYPTLDPVGAPATLSRTIVERLRRRARFDGLVVSDALIMEAALAGRTGAVAAVTALAAGVDILLYPGDVSSTLEAVGAALDNGTLPRARVEEALGRYDAALAALAEPAPPTVSGPYPSAAALADALLTRGTLRGAGVTLRAPIDLVLVDDDIGGPYPASPSDYVRHALQQLGVPLGPGGSRVTLVFCEPRGWKGRPGLSADSRAQTAERAPTSDLVALFAHPRLLADIPGHAPVLLSWHRQRLMQEAVARAIAAALAPRP